MSTANPSVIETHLNQSNCQNPPGKKARKRALQKAAAFTSKLRSANPLPNDPETERIYVRLTSGGTAFDLAEEGYRICRVNASLRRDLDDARKAPLVTDNDAARIKAKLDNGVTTVEIAEEAYRVCRINAYLRKDVKGAHGDLRLAKKKMATKDDASSEMRAEYPVMRKLLKRAWGMLASRKVDVPEDMRRTYEKLMDVDWCDWQVKKDRNVRSKEKMGGKKSEKTEGKENGQKKNESDKTMFLLHTQQGKTYDLRKPLEEQDSEGEQSELEPEPKPESLPSKKRKAFDTEGPVAKKVKLSEIEEDYEEGEIHE
jgi:hypothetical protein